MKEAGLNCHVETNSQEDIGSARYMSNILPNYAPLGLLCTVSFHIHIGLL